MYKYLSIFSRFRAATVVGLTLAAAGPAAGVVIQSNGSLPANLPTDVFGTWGLNAAAIAVGDEWVLTNRHQDNGLINREVTIGGQTYDALASNQIVLDEDIDLRLVRLTDQTTGNPANLTVTAEFFDGNPVNKTYVVGGYGPTIGAPDGSDGFDWSGSQNNSNGLNFGQNRINAVTSVGGGDFDNMAILAADFDQAPGNGSLDREATLAPGDSGGGWFILDGGDWKLAGLTHAIEPDTGDTHPADAFFGQQTFAVDLRPFTDQIERIVNQDYQTGDYNGDFVVSQPDLDLVLLNWGQSRRPEGWVAVDQINGAISQGELDGVLLNWGSVDLPALGLGQPVSVVPEPATALLVLAGGTALVSVRRRSRA